MAQPLATFGYGEIDTDTITVYEFSPGSIGIGELGREISEFLFDPVQYIVSNFPGSGFDATWTLHIQTVNHGKWMRGTTIGATLTLYSGIKHAVIALYKHLIPEPPEPSS